MTDRTFKVMRKGQWFHEEPYNVSVRPSSDFRGETIYFETPLPTKPGDTVLMGIVPDGTGKGWQSIAIIEDEDGYPMDWRIGGKVK